MEDGLRVVLVVLLTVAACQHGRDFDVMGSSPSEDAGAGGEPAQENGASTGGAAHDGGADAGAGTGGAAHDGGADAGAGTGGAAHGGGADAGASTGGAAHGEAADAGASAGGAPDVNAGSCPSRWADGALVADDFSDACSLEHWDVRAAIALHEPLLLDGLRLELTGNAPQPLKRWWESDNGAYVHQSINADGFVVRAEVHVTSNRLDGQLGAGRYQVGGLLVTGPGEFTGDWVFNGLGFINGASRDCPTDEDAMGVVTGFFGVLSEWTHSTGCVTPSQATRAELAICRYRERVIAYQRPIAEDAPEDANWATVHSGSIEPLEGELRIGMAISVETHDPPEVVARFPWIVIDTSGIDSFADCSIENFNARFGAYDLPSRRTSQAR